MAKSIRERLPIPSTAAILLPSTDNPFALYQKKALVWLARSRSTSVKRSRNVLSKTLASFALNLTIHPHSRTHAEKQLKGSLARVGSNGAWWAHKEDPFFSFWEESIPWASVPWTYFTYARCHEESGNRWSKVMVLLNAFHFTQRITYHPEPERSAMPRGHPT